MSSQAAKKGSGPAYSRSSLSHSASTRERGIQLSGAEVSCSGRWKRKQARVDERTQNTFGFLHEPTRSNDVARESFDAQIRSCLRWYELTNRTSRTTSINLSRIYTSISIPLIPRLQEDSRTRGLYRQCNCPFFFFILSIFFRCFHIRQ